MKPKYSIFAVVTAVILFSGCGTWRKTASVTVTPATGKVIAQNAENATAPAKVETEKTETVTTIGAGTKAEIPAEVAGKPVVVSVVLPAIKVVSEEMKTAATASNERAPDKSVEIHKIDAAERRWLLWAAIGCGIVGVVIRQLMPAWPSLSHGLLVGAALAFGAWKFDQIPQWIFAVVIGAVALIALGYKRSEWDANHNGIPDVLEKK